MAEFKTDIYRSGAPDLLGGYKEGMTMRRLGMQNDEAERELKEQQAIRDAYKNNTVIGPDGKPTVNQAGLMSEIGRVNGQKAYEHNQALSKDKLDQMVKHSQVGAQLLGQAVDQNSYSQVRAQLIQSGLMDEKNLPEQFDQKLVRGLEMRSLTALERLQMQMKKDELEESRRMRWAMAGAQKGEREEKETNAAVEKLQTKLSPLQDIQNSIGTVESKMKFKLDTYDPDTETALIDGKKQKVDLPGASIPGIGRVTAYSNAARDLETAMARVFNVELKDRSGAAVTTPELERLKAEFGSGKFNTEAEKIGALREYQKLATIAMKNVEAGYSPKAVRTYGERGGMTSQTVGGSDGDAELQALLAEKKRRSQTARVK
jgi:hypothetical protein